MKKPITKTEFITPNSYLKPAKLTTVFVSKDHPKARLRTQINLVVAKASENQKGRKLCLNYMTTPEAVAMTQKQLRDILTDYKTKLGLI